MSKKKDQNSAAAIERIEGLQQELSQARALLQTSQAAVSDLTANVNELRAQLQLSMARGQETEQKYRELLNS